MSRTFVIGDIHGALEALKQVMNKLNPQKQDLLIFLGDYVDGWPESAQVIEHLIEIDKRYSCIFIKGNHDFWCENWLGGEPPASDWFFQGGKATIESYSKMNDMQKEQHLAFFRAMKPYYIDSRNRLFIHAGFTSLHGPEKERYESNFWWDRTLWEMALAMDRKMKQDSKLYPKRLQLFDEIYIGHTPTIKYDKEVPMNAGNVWNIDTGAAFYGKLSALNIENKEYWQSDHVQALYPGVKGREM